ncbi:putative nicotinate-nucleotide adenylyltransferase [Bacteroidales bacterium]|nr:putative nicotinate-nucleotide adenylyltransferase [Bacteroidales bacterium]
MRVGVFPGSFNPIHIGHLAIANFICEMDNFDEIWFLVTPLNPLKTADEIAANDVRVQMVEKSIEGYDKFKVCTIEWDMPRPNYSINTLQKLKMTFPENDFELIIGTDNWAIFHRWKDFQRILNNFKVIIYPRAGNYKIDLSHPNANECQAPMIDISSTFIRKQLKKGKDMRFFMPHGVAEMVVIERDEEPTKEE